MNHQGHEGSRRKPVTKDLGGTLTDWWSGKPHKQPFVLGFTAWHFQLSEGPILEEITMRKSWLMCVLLGTLAWGQAAPSAPAPPQPAQAPPADTSAAVPPEAAVITVIGVCAAQPQPAVAKGTPAKSDAAAKDPAAKT